MMAADARVIDMPDLKDLERLSQRINPATDEFNVALETIQDKVNSFALGVEVWLKSTDDELAHEISSVWTELDGAVVVEWDEDDKKNIRQFRVVSAWELGYGRLGEGWALLV